MMRECACACACAFEQYFRLTPPTNTVTCLTFEIEKNLLLYNIVSTQSSLNSFYEFIRGKPSKKSLNDQRSRNMTLCSYRI